jgi:hypothetical protein
MMSPDLIILYTCLIVPIFGLFALLYIELKAHRKKTELLQEPDENLVIMCNICLKTTPYIPGAQAKHTCKGMTWDFESVRPGVTGKGE